MKLSPIAKHYHESRNKDVNENSDQNTLIKASAYSAYQLNKPALALKIIAAKNTRDGEIRDNAGLCTRLHYRLTEQFRLGWAKEIKAKDSEILDPGAPSKPVFDRASYPFLNAVQRGGSSEINNAQPPSDQPPGDKPPGGQPPSAQSQGGHDLNPNPPPDLNNQYDVPAPDAADVADVADAAAADAAAADAPEQPQEPVENLPHNLNPNLVVAPEPAPTPPPTPPGSPADAAIELAVSEAEINDDGSEGKGSEARGSASPSPSGGRTGLNFGGDPKTPEASPPSSPTAPSSPVFERKNPAASDSSGEGGSEKDTDSHRKSRGGSGASFHSGSIKLDDSEGPEGAAGGRPAPAPAPATLPPAPSTSPTLPAGGGRDRGASGRGSPASGDESKNTQPLDPSPSRQRGPRYRRLIKPSPPPAPKPFTSLSPAEVVPECNRQFPDVNSTDPDKKNQTHARIKDIYVDLLEKSNRARGEERSKLQRLEQKFGTWAMSKGVRL